MLKKFWSILLLPTCLSLFTLNSLTAQELNAKVQVLSPNVARVNKQVFRTLETSIREFLNNTKWTNETYTQEERINCNFVINVETNNSIDQFETTIQVQYSRPIYNSDYDSPVLIHRDDQFDFQYLEYDRLDFAENQFISNLTSVLAFYAYVIIGLDHDTYELRGGTKYLQKAQDVVNNAQGGRYSGWSSLENNNNNRFWLMDNLLSPAFDQYRVGLYNYHRLGLDRMYEPSQQNSAKQLIKQSIISLKQVNDKRRNSIVLEIYFDAKGIEIVDIFGGGQPIPLADLKEVLLELDANNANRYEKLGKR